MMIYDADIICLSACFAKRLKRARIGRLPSELFYRCGIDKMLSPRFNERRDIVKIEKNFFDSKASMYEQLDERLAEIIGDGGDALSVLANASALLNLFLADINWVGFYLMKDGLLKLGPFQGKPAVAEIRPGDGVCGTAVLARATQIVSDVHLCTNHIVCDPDSASEIVVPMLRGDAVLGVLDIDSPRAGRFDEEDRTGLERFVDRLLDAIC